MSVTYDRFKINCLIKMAKITEISEQRERYITLAEEELNKREKLEIDSIEMFLIYGIRSNVKAKVPRSEVYERYVTFCESKGYAISTKNVLYRSMRESGLIQKKIMVLYTLLLISLNESEVMSFVHASNFNRKYQRKLLCFAVKYRRDCYS